jgi:hypothetical protein
MESVNIENSEVVWVVSSGITGVGESQDYQIEELDLTDKSAKTVQLLQEKLGDGVFVSYEAAAQWIAVRLAKDTGYCQEQKKVGSGKCCCRQAQSCNNEDSAAQGHI